MPKAALSDFTNAPLTVSVFNYTGSHNYYFTIILSNALDYLREYDSFLTLRSV